MKKNLISVSQLTRDNNVIAEFYSNSCLIKNKGTRSVLLRGLLKDGLYQLSLAFDHATPVSSSSIKPEVFSTNVSSLTPLSNQCKM